MGAIRITYFYNGSGGGVLSVIRNLFKYRQNTDIENHLVYSLKREAPFDVQTPFLPEAVSVGEFRYSSQWNFFHICKKLSALLPDEKSVIVASDLLELGMASHLGLSNPVVQILHGHYEYYYKLAMENQDVIDKFICVAEDIKTELQNRLPSRKEDIHYVRFPVPPAAGPVIGKKMNSVVFVGRCEKSKGYHLLPDIAAGLRERGYDFEWHILGEGSEKKENQTCWPAGVSVMFHGKMDQESLLKEVSRHAFIVLPSTAEGMPLSVIEAMKAGLVPVVNDLAGGLRELVKEGDTGYRIAGNAVAGYVSALTRLHDSGGERERLSLNARKHAEALFDPVTNTRKWEDIILESLRSNRKKTKRKIYGSRLDRPWIPNFITTLLRKII